ncbi:hypothetical protein EWM64_g8823 [Hericium alpestre]|uniref:Protein kinase domain-containing protein n=1 Tax=Hericium alpestre TaxID=135208 RepID=A0A4Y9ZLP9_9AGAM|nr:hypothetical protein EWM64_g8823 [Hericium alpestre]
MQNDHNLRVSKRDLKKMPPRAVPLPDRFANELKAYNRLLQTDVCENGFVPRPYGWFIFTGFDDPYWQTMQNGGLPASPYDEWLKDFKEEMRSPRALLLEWIETPRLKTPKITADQFRCIFKTLEELHRARIMHRDVSPRQFFVRGSKVVITDFDAAIISPPNSDVDMVATTMEVRDALWNLFLKEEYM